MMDIEGVRRLLLAVSIVAVLAILTRFVLKPYSLELVHIVVVNAVANKISDDLPKSRVYDAFSKCLDQVKDSQNQDQYMQHLLTLSHRLEKVQYLEKEEVEKLLVDLKCN